MARKFGKRGKSGAGQQQDPAALFGAPQPPRQSARPASSTPGPVTRVLVGLNLAVFVLEIATGGRLGFDLSGAFNSKLIAWGGLQPLEIALKGEYYRLITATFLHGGLLHVALNMYVLWLLGSMIEPALGSGRFAAVYFISGLTATDLAARSKTPPPGEISFAS